MKDYNIYEPIEIFLNKNNIDYDTDYEKSRETVRHWLILDNSIITKELDNKIREFLDTLEDAEHWDINIFSDDNEYLIVHTDYDLTDTMYEQRLYTSINEFKHYLYENKAPQNITELYDTYGDKYPYATAAISYFVFGDNESDNIIKKSIDGVYGKNTSIDYETINDYMLQYENGWYDYIEDIEEFVKNLPTKDGEILSYYY